LASFLKHKERQLLRNNKQEASDVYENTDKKASRQEKKGRASYKDGKAQRLAILP
jgi:hypothetical protein